MLGLWDENWQGACRYQQKALIFRLLLVLTTFLACTTYLEGGSPKCVPTKPLHHVTLSGGIAAGDYMKIGAVVSPNACANLCCKNTRCDVAFMADNMCYNLHCYSAKLCETRAARESRFYVSVTYVKRGIGHEGRTVLDRVEPAKGNLTQEIKENHLNINSEGQNFLKSGTNVSKQNQSLVHSYNNDTQNYLPGKSAFDKERAKKPLVNLNSERSYARNSTNMSESDTASKNFVNGKLQEFYENRENAAGTHQLDADDSKASLKDSKNAHKISSNGSVKYYDIASSEGNNSLRQDNHAEASALKRTFGNQIKVSWKNDSHILVKELVRGYTRTTVNSTRKDNSAGRSDVKGGVKMPKHNTVDVLYGSPREENSTNNGTKTLQKQHVQATNISAKNDTFTRTFGVLNSAQNQHGSKNTLLNNNYSTYGSIKDKEKLEDELLDKSFSSVNNFSMRNATSNNNSSTVQLTLNKTAFSFPSANINRPSKGVLKGKSFTSKEKGIQLDISSPSVVGQSWQQSESNMTSTVKTNISSPETILSVQTDSKEAGCHPGGILYNKTLIAGLKSGDFTDYGKVKGMDTCAAFCCADGKCDMALMLGLTCYTLHCASESRCKVRPAHPSSLNPQISFVFRNKPVQSKVNVHDNQSKKGSPQTVTQGKQVSKRVKGSRCKHGSIQQGVTLKSGQKAGIFNLRLKSKDMDSCLSMCCKDKTCNVAFLIDDSCYSVRCHSHEDCTITKAKSSKARSSLSVVRSRILPMNDKRQQISRIEKKYTTVLNITNQLFSKPLSDFESLEFLNLAERVQIAVSMVLGNFKEYKESEVISFQPSPLITKLQLTVFDGAPIKKILITLVKTVKDGKMVSSIDGSILTFLVSTSGFKFYTPEGFNLVCDPEFDYDVHWKLTVFNFHTTSPCPRKAQGETRRGCHGSDNSNATWSFPSFVGCVSSEYKTLHSKAKKFAEGAKKKIPFKTLHSQLAITPSDILIRIQKLTFMDTYRALLDRPHNFTNTTLHRKNKTLNDHMLKHTKSMNPNNLINSTKESFANKTFSIPLPDTKNPVKQVPFKPVSPHVNNSSNGRTFPQNTNNATLNKFPKVLPVSTMTGNTAFNATLFSDIFPKAANATFDSKPFSRTNIPKPSQGNILGKPGGKPKYAGEQKPYSSHQVYYGQASSKGSHKAPGLVRSSYNQNINMVNKELPFRKNSPYGYHQQQQLQQQPKVTDTGLTNKLRYPQISGNHLGTAQSAVSDQVRSSYPSQLASYPKKDQNLQSPYSAYKQQQQRLSGSLASRRWPQPNQALQGSNALFNKQASQSVRGWQGGQVGQNNNFGQSNKLGRSNPAWSNPIQSQHVNQEWQGYRRTFPGYGGIPGYRGMPFQGQSGNQNAQQMDIRRRRKRDTYHTEKKRPKRQGGNMMWYNNYSLKKPDLRSEVYRPSPAVSRNDEEPFLTNVQAGYDDPKDLLNQQDPLSYNIDYVRPTPNYQSITYQLGKNPSPSRATTSDSQSEFDYFPTIGVRGQASTRGSFSSPDVSSKNYPAGYPDLAPAIPEEKPQPLVGFGNPQEEQQLPTNKPLTLPVTTVDPFFVNQQGSIEITSPQPPLPTTRATVKTEQIDTKPSPKPPTLSLKPTMKPSVEVTHSRAELLKKKLLDMVKPKGTVKPLTTTHKNNGSEHLLDDVLQEENRAPMFGGDIALIVDTLRQLSLYSKYTNPPETVDTLKQFLQVGSHILDKRNKHEWKYLTKESPTSVSALDAAEIIEEHSKMVSEKLHPYDMKKPILTTNIMVVVLSVDLMVIDTSQDFQFPNYSEPSVANWTDATDKLVISPRSLVNALQGTPSKKRVQLISCNVRRITDLLPRSLVSKAFGNDSIIGGHVMSVSANPSLGDDIDPPIKIVLNNNDKGVSNFEEKCVFWEQGSSPSGGKWSSHGCSFVESNVTHTTCECTHMSTFSAIANTAKLKATAPATFPPTTPPAPEEEEGSNILYILLGILALLVIAFIILVIICFLIKRRKRQKESDKNKSGGRGGASGRRSTASSDDSRSTGSGQFDEMLASRRRNVHPEHKPTPSDSPRWQRMRKNGENPDNLMLKEKSYLLSDYHQPYHFSSSKTPPPSDLQRNRSGSS